MYTIQLGNGNRLAKWRNDCRCYCERQEPAIFDSREAAQERLRQLETLFYSLYVSEALHLINGARVVSMGGEK